MKFKNILLLLTLVIGCFHPLFSEEPTAPAENAVQQLQVMPDLEPAKDVEEDRFLSAFLHMLWVLGLLVAALLAFSWVVKRLLTTRLTQYNKTDGIKILERRALSAKTTLYVLEIHGKKIAFAESQSGVAFLGALGLFPEIVEKSPSPVES